MGVSEVTDEAGKWPNWLPSQEIHQPPPQKAYSAQLVSENLPSYQTQPLRLVGAGMVSVAQPCRCVPPLLQKLM